MLSSNKRRICGAKHLISAAAPIRVNKVNTDGITELMFEYINNRDKSLISYYNVQYGFQSAKKIKGPLGCLISACSVLNQ